MDAHERWYYELYDYDVFYNDIRNGLRTLVSRHINNFQDAVHELYNFCARLHLASPPLCASCEITKHLLEIANNEEHSEVFSERSRFLAFFYDD